MAREHPVTRAMHEALEAAQFYELVGMRARVAEEIVGHARTLEIMERDNSARAAWSEVYASLMRSVTRLGAIEARIRELSPAVYFDRSGEACIRNTR